MSYVFGGVVVDCWGYNMMGFFINVFLVFIILGFFFSCGLYVVNFIFVCWGDEIGSGVIIMVLK